jgi:putative MATE family efflux protein
MERKLDLTADPLPTLLLRLAAPAALMMLLYTFYNYVDTFFVGYLGADALAGLAVSSFILWMLFALAQLFSVGTAAKTARRLGENNREEAERTALRGVIYSLVWGGAAALVLAAAEPALFRFTHASPAVEAHARAYLLPTTIGLPLIFLPFMFNAIFIAAGDTRSPLLIMTVSLVANALLDPILIFGWAGLPPLGVAGAAWAAVATRVLWTFLALRRLTAWRRTRIRLAAHGRLGLGWRDLAEVARIGAPNAATGVLFSGVYLALTRVAASFGAANIAALRIGHIYEGLSFATALGFSVASGTLVGQNLGAAKPQRAARAAWLAAGFVGLFTAAVGLLFRTFPDELARIFTADPDVARDAAAYLLVLAWSQPFMGVELIMEGSFAGAGNTLPPMAIQLPLTVLRYPVAYLLSQPLGVDGIWWAISGSSMLKCVLLMWWFRRGNWARTKV